jgi:response regulator RpfG family c-di-GMP phosphodiesterase
MNIRNRKKILVIDDDSVLCRTIQKYLEKRDFVSIPAHNCEAALNIMDSDYPHVIVVDINMPGMSGLEFLKLIRQKDKIIPIIITTGDPNINTMIEAIHNGAQDYIIKPFSLSLLYDKIQETLDVVNKYKSSNVLSELVSIHSVSNKLSSTHDYEEVMDIALRSCQQSTRAGRGYIMLSDDDKNLNLVRVLGQYHGPEKTNVSKNDSEWEIAKWVFRKNRAIALYDGNSFPYKNLPFAKGVKGITIVAPIRINGVPKGVVSMSRREDAGDHGRIEMSLLEILAGQIGNALGSVELYNTLNKRISDLHFISDYAEKFVGLVDPENVVRSFIDTICNYFNVSYVGVLYKKRRGAVLFYWTDRGIPDTLNQAICAELVDCYNEYTRNEKVSSAKTLMEPVYDVEHTTLSDGTYEYSKLVPLMWDDMEFGSMVLKWDKKDVDFEENLKLLRGIINQTRIALTNAKLFNDIKENYIRTIKALAIAVDAKDTYTHGHSENVMFFSEILARYINLDAEYIQAVKDGGLLHDIGKIGIPGVILNKPGPLTPAEYNGFMKTHPSLGADIIKDVPFLRDLKPIILYHHEHQDGSGYPQGLRGEDIPIGARIVHIADAFEAMTSNRPYRNSLGNAEALRRLKAGRGSQFDAELVDSFIASMLQAGKISEDDLIDVD